MCQHTVYAMFTPLCFPLIRFDASQSCDWNCCIIEDCDFWSFAPHTNGGQFPSVTPSSPSEVPSVGLSALRYPCNTSPFIAVFFIGPFSFYYYPSSRACSYATASLSPFIRLATHPYSIHPQHHLSRRLPFHSINCSIDCAFRSAHYLLVVVCGTVG